MSMRSHKLRPVITKPEQELDETGKALSTTPTAKEALIAERLPCPHAPRKRRSDKWSYTGGGVVREYFSVPDLESVFLIRPVGSAN